ncbi:hypothetical protein CWE09_11380 [Aliidiomarina minuta]|uniref:KOW domain-containing protein n=1 Tax=Aliidiomarina minuta TaxID=880057 RepID=A0A432W4L6_9GAMM|nr:hypothetical protein CWE09_11380 [Aliidiomarina minuta]
MNLKHIRIGQYLFVSKTGSSYDGEEGKVISIFSDYGLDSKLVSIRLLLDDGTVIGGFKAEEVSP